MLPIVRANKNKRLIKSYKKFAEQVQSYFDNLDSSVPTLEGLSHYVKLTRNQLAKQVQLHPEVAEIYDYAKDKIIAWWLERSGEGARIAPQITMMIAKNYSDGYYKEKVEQEISIEGKTINLNISKEDLNLFRDEATRLLREQLLGDPNNNE